MVWDLLQIHAAYLKNVQTVTELSGCPMRHEFFQKSDPSWKTSFACKKTLLASKRKNVKGTSEVQAHPLVCLPSHFKKAWAIWDDQISACFEVAHLVSIQDCEHNRDMHSGHILVQYFLVFSLWRNYSTINWKQQLIACCPIFFFRIQHICKTSWILERFVPFQ